MSAARGTPLLGGHRGLDEPDAQAQRAEHAAHPFRVALGEVVVHGDDVDPLAGERVQVGREGRGEGLALAGAHLRDAPAVQDDAAHELDVEVTLPDRAPGRLADRREGLGEQVVEGFPRLEAGAERGGPRREVRVGQGRDGALEVVDRIHDLLEAPDPAPFTDLSELLEDHAQPHGAVGRAAVYRRGRNGPSSVDGDGSASG